MEQVPGLKQVLENVTRAIQESTAATDRSTEVSARVETIATRLEVAYHELKDEVVDIRRRIDGSKPPPTGTPPIARSLGEVAAKAHKAHASSSQHDLDVPALRAELHEIRGELAAQSRVMGIGKKGIRWLMSPRGMKTAVSLATLAGALYTAFHASEAAHQPPPPTVILPAPQGSR